MRKEFIKLLEEYINNINKLLSNLDRYYLTINDIESRGNKIELSIHDRRENIYEVNWFVWAPIKTETNEFLIGDDITIWISNIIKMNN